MTVGFIRRKLSEEPGRAATDFAISTYFAAPAGCPAVQVGAPNTHQAFLVCKQRWKICPSERHEQRTLVVYPQVAAGSWQCHQPVGARGCWSCCEEQTASTCPRAVLLLPVPRRCGSCVQLWLAPWGCLRSSSSLFMKGGGRPGQAQEVRWVSRTSPCSSGLPARTVPALCLQEIWVAFGALSDFADIDALLQPCSGQVE